MEKRPWLWTRREEERHGIHDRGKMGEEGERRTEKYPRIWPGTTTHYRQAIKETRWEDWEVRYKDDREGGDAFVDNKDSKDGDDKGRFAWLGDGICTDQDEEMGGYLREGDKDP